MARNLTGADAKFYLKSTALTAIAVAADVTTASIVDNVKDVTISEEFDETDTTTRGTASSGIKTRQVTLKGITVTFTMNWLPGDTNFTTLRTAHENRSEVFGLFSDQAATIQGAQGRAGNWNVKKFSKNEKLPEAQAVDVELILSSFPSWYIKS